MSATAALPAPTLTENKRQAGIVKALKRDGAWIVKLHQTGRTRRGLPDLIACYRGIFIAVEVKQPHHKTAAARTQHQIRELHDVRAAGGIAIIATTYQDVREALDDIDEHLEHHDHLSFAQRPLPARDVIDL